MNKQKTFSAWQLYGAGLENLKKNTLPIPEPGPGEILVHVDAVGLCFSDLKIIRAGATHPKLWWKDLDQRPLTPGHEAVLTIVKPGPDIPAQYQAGKRCLIQCDIFIHDRSCAFGYGMNGAYSEYQIIDRRVWQGEQRSYLLPIPDHLSAVGTALIEPWSCVNGAYHLTYRRTPAPGGKVLAVTDRGNPAIYRAGKLFQEYKVAEIFTLNFSAEAVRALETELGVPVKTIAEIPEDGQYDDVICCDLTDQPLLERAIAHTAWRGIAGFLGRTPAEKCGIDVGALHYCHRYYQGSCGNDFSSLYQQESRSRLRPGGAAWFPGGAGAMGQMHVELALAAGGPDKILVTDLDDKRIAHLQTKLGAKAKKLGKELCILNSKTMTGEAFDAFLKNFAPQGFDDVVILVPAALIAEHAMQFLNDGAVVNFFAGIPAGVAAKINIDDFVSRRIRLIGSSGSSFDDMADTLQLAIEGNFKPQSALAAIAGMNFLKKGLEAVAAGTYPGKIAILPACPDLPLTAITELGKLDAALPSTLDEDGNYTLETEKFLLRKF